MPFMQAFASSACNLSCEYCSQSQTYHQSIKDSLFQNEDFLKFLDAVPPTHFYLSGGEPTIHPGFDDFLERAGQRGHMISLDTNFVISTNKLRQILDRIDTEKIGFINISHHLGSKYKIDYFLTRSRLLSEYSIPHFVKYIGVPEHITQIQEYMSTLSREGIGTGVTILQGNWRGRVLPTEYTDEEMFTLLNMVTTVTHGLQFFDGVKSKGLMCRGGNDFLVYNMQEDRALLPCCHGSKFPMHIKSTWYASGVRTRNSCQIDTCLGDLMLIYGINGVLDEVERFGRIVKGESPSLGAQFVMNEIDKIRTAGYKLVNEARFLDLLAKVGDVAGNNETSTGSTAFNLATNGASNDQDSQKLIVETPAASDVHANGNGTKPPLPPLKIFIPNHSLREWQCLERFMTLDGDQILRELEEFVTQWKTPEEVVRSNPSLANELVKAAEKLFQGSKEKLARNLSKIVAQHKFFLPRKINIEVSSTCMLRCEFCDLTEMKKQRDKVLMDPETFAHIWKYMEVFVTEVEFTGGEPLLNKNLFTMLAAARDSEVYSTLTTNAQLLDQKRVDKLLKAPPTRLLIAMDGVDAETYEGIRKRSKFPKLIQHVMQLVESRNKCGMVFPHVDLQMVLNKQNIHQRDDYYRVAGMLGVDHAHTKPVFIWPNSGNEFRQKVADKLVTETDENGYHSFDADGGIRVTRMPGECPNVQQVHIGSGGEVVPCWYVLVDSEIAGNAGRETFLEIWYSEEYFRLRHKMVQDSLYAGCSHCIGKGEGRHFTVKSKPELQELAKAGMAEFINRATSPRAQESTIDTGHVN